VPSVWWFCKGCRFLGPASLGCFCLFFFRFFGGPLEFGVIRGRMIFFVSEFRLLFFFSGGCMWLFTVMLVVCRRCALVYRGSGDFGRRNRFGHLSFTLAVAWVSLWALLLIVPI